MVPVRGLLQPTERRPGGGGGGAAQQSGGNDQLVFGAQGMAERRHFFAHNGGSHRPATQAGILSYRNCGGLGAAVGAHVNPQNLVHKSSPHWWNVGWKQMVVVSCSRKIGESLHRLPLGR